MNHLQNGDIAIGSPESIARLKQEHEIEIIAFPNWLNNWLPLP
jgi:hypothetical protein